MGHVLSADGAKPDNEMWLAKKTLQPVKVDLPQQIVGMDLFHYENSNFLIVVVYYSGFNEYSILQDTTTATVITHIKSIFA